MFIKVIHVTFVYYSHTYFGEYPLSFAACLGQKEAVMYLLRRKACPNKKDTNGNTVLHMVVIHDRPVSNKLGHYTNYREIFEF